MEEQNAAAKLDLIREGGLQLVVIALERLRECEQAITEGRFEHAHERATELMSRLAPLAQAESYIAFFGETYVVRGREVQEGMVLRSWGRVTGIEHEHLQRPGDEPRHNVRLTFDDEERGVEVGGEQEIVALRAP